MKKQIRMALCMFSALVVLTSSMNAQESTPYMTYRDNAVTLRGSGEISINTGAFTVSSLKITNGQDPDNYNEVGQTYVLQNSAFTFHVGRSGSKEVADWFNSQFSGYNDSSINGDRTTFDQTADKLNFAFVGTLEIAVTSPEYPNGLSVTFPDVAFAQGSTLFSNNWWFGQLNGQHTRDSDGPDTLLTIGYTPDGDTVYASFLRGDNGVNEVSLEAICVANTARDDVTYVSNVRAQFDALPLTGTQVNLRGFPGSYDPTVNHIQGYARYSADADLRYSILTHSVSSASYAHIVAGPEHGNEKWGFKTYLQNWRHPGGIQVIGDYLLVPSEQEASAQIALYDLRSLAANELRRVETFDLAVNHKAGALAITSYVDACGTVYYVLIVAHLDGENSVYHVYRANAENGIETANFIEVGSFPFDKDFQGFGLVTDAATNDIYLIGMWSPAEGATFADYVYLYQLSTESWTLGEELGQHHMVSVGGAVGMLGVHFRYGAGVDVSENGFITLSATERNSVLGSALATNIWSES